jgi:hypothetical protein
LTSKESEIASLVKNCRELSTDEMKAFLKGKFTQDIDFFSRLIIEHEKRIEWVKSQPTTCQLIIDAENFYDDLILDGFIKKDFDLFKQDIVENRKSAQSREEYCNNLDELISNKNIDQFEAFRKMNRTYVNNYESTINLYFISIAQKISGNPKATKGNVLSTLMNYREGKYSSLFDSFVPQIRNSIQHQNFIIDTHQPIISFFDNKKTPLVLPLRQYSEIFWKNFFVAIAFDAAYFELKQPLLKIIIEAVNTVQGFLKKRGTKLPSRYKDLSILDLALLIKNGELI